MNPKFQHLDDETLSDLLAHQASRYTKLLNEGGRFYEIEDCQHILHYLMEEIDKRRKRQDNDPANRADR